MLQLSSIVGHVTSGVKQLTDMYAILTVETETPIFYKRTISSTGM